MRAFLTLLLFFSAAFGSFSFPIPSFSEISGEFQKKSKESTSERRDSNKSFGEKKHRGRKLELLGIISDGDGGGAAQFGLSGGRIIALSVGKERKIYRRLHLKLLKIEGTKRVLVEISDMKLGTRKKKWIELQD